MMSEFNVGVCKDNEVIKEIFKEYSQIKGAESCFVSFDKELADLDGYYKGGALLLGPRLEALPSGRLMMQPVKLRDYS